MTLEHSKFSQARPQGMPIACTLSVISLELSPEYGAVSYVWGDRSMSRSILIDVMHLGARLDIWNFFDQMRKREESQRIS